MKRTFLVLSLLCSLILLLALSYGNYNNAQEPFHTPAELSFFSSHRTGPLVPGEWYLPSASCRGCHGFDSLQQANVNEDGQDVNLVMRWEASMMALSAKDPLWRAKVTHEILVNPAHEGALQDKCTSCHAPTGRYNHAYRGLGDYRLTNLYNDSLGLDGVNCSGCHTIGPDVGQTFSGIIPFDTTRNIYGPFTNPMTGPMQLYEGYFPMYSPHTDEARFCSSCHTLITETIDLAGNLTGGKYVEQATYHEYLNSTFPANNITCQTCHMPRLESPVVIANGYIALQPRQPFNQHTFAGANTFMLNLMRTNKAALGINVPVTSFDTSIEATTHLLRQRSVDLTLHHDSTTSDTAYFRVQLHNKGGHKFPSGYPSRRAVLQFVVKDQSGDTIFRSGIFDQDFRVVGETPQCEPHHNIIRQDNRTQIYELVMGDVNNNFTSVLARAANTLKDNRIPPSGFTTSHPSYDTVRISADALADADFNRSGATQGTADDFVHFHIPLNSASGTLSVETHLFYQAVPPKWLDEMFQFTNSTIDTFRTMYNAADKTPFLIASDTISIISSSLASRADRSIALVSPTASSGYFTIRSAQSIRELMVFSSGGKLILQSQPRAKQYQLDLSDRESGVYYVRVSTSEGTVTEKILKF